MSATNELLDEVKEVCSFPSDMAIAEKLGINRQMLWKARHEDKPLSDERIAQLCAMAKLDGATWLARIHAERAATQVERALWKSVLDRLTPVTAVVGALAVVAVGLHAGAHEGLLTALSQAAITLPSIHYAKSYC
ncbi:hypothetical protein ADT27_19710 [Xanthomonas oryzae]|uniref:DUF3693 domain-containing protein n=1 Tax=Xanthomonas oryzae TaxID=347 RepID=UPI0006C38F88|nr:DUF3693 domain-containing protein [Xanthomonas oryzae]KOR41008.1 hypothetical protein ADT27_19710 [Xanthomonas oryzae]MEC5080529.1 DUF3693 domain-containing protein [Xanthomonas oryzae pv. oryzicola]